MHPAIMHMYMERFVPEDDVTASIIFLHATPKVRDAPTYSIPRTALSRTIERTPADARHIHFMLSLVFISLLQIH